MELLEEILNQNNLNKAYKKVVANKGVAGVDGITVEEEFDYLKENKDRIINQIRKRKYKPQPVKRVQIPKDNGKMRNLGIPTVTDRIIQQAIFQVISPIFEKQFNDNSFGFRPNRSCEQAVIRALEYLNDGYECIIDIDLEKFFDTVNQDKLITIIGKTITDGDVVSLIRKYLSAGVMEKGIVKATTVGTPQGGNLSPLLSNIMLNELDKELEARGLNFVRYADDCIVLVKSEKAAKLVRKLKQLTDRSWSISLDNRIKKINYVVRGWANYFRIANMKNKITEIDEHLRVRIRVIIWKQWKKIRKKCESLQKLGVPFEIAFNCANTRKGYYQICKTRYIQFAINNERLRKRGLVFLLDQYEKVHI